MLAAKRREFTQGGTAGNVIQNLSQAAEHPPLSTVARAIGLVAAHLDEGLLGGRQGDGW